MNQLFLNRDFRAGRFDLGSTLGGNGQTAARTSRVPRKGESLHIETGETTVLLAKWRNRENSVFEELMPPVYPHLPQVAPAYIPRERNPDLLQATALVHELYFN